MARNHAYCIHYRMIGDEEKMIDVLAPNKYAAYDIATFEAIPEKEGSVPYSSWVSSVTYNNGNCHYFDTSEGNCY